MLVEVRIRVPHLQVFKFESNEDAGLNEKTVRKIMTLVKS